MIKINIYYIFKYILIVYIYLFTNQNLYSKLKYVIGIITTRKNFNYQL